MAGFWLKTTICAPKRHSFAEKLRGFPKYLRPFSEKLRGFPNSLRPYSKSLRASAAKLRWFSEKLRWYSKSLRWISGKLRGFAAMRSSSAGGRSHRRPHLAAATAGTMAGSRHERREEDALHKPAWRDAVHYGFRGIASVWCSTCGAAPAVMAPGTVTGGLPPGRSLAPRSRGPS